MWDDKDRAVASWNSSDGWFRISLYATPRL